MKKKNFSLIELLIVIVIIGLIAAMVLPQMSNLGDDAEEATARYNARATASQIALFKASTGKYPAKFHSGIKVQGKGYGCISSEGLPYHNAHNPVNGQDVNNATGNNGGLANNPSTLVDGLAENTLMNLRRAIQVPVNQTVPLSLARAGISRIMLGDINVDVADSQLIGLGNTAGDQWDINKNYGNEIFLYTAAGGTPQGDAGFLAVNSWEDADGNQVVFNGRTIPQIINQKIISEKSYCRQVAAFIVGPQVDWNAWYNTDGTWGGIAKVGVTQANSKNSKTYCVAFFAVDMTGLPATFLGCVDANGKVIPTN